MKTHIPKELAQWLKERGCEIESEAYHVSKDGKTFILSTQTKFIYGSAPDLSEAEYPFIYPAYSWYDILVTHAKEFWGEEDVCPDCWEKLGFSYVIIEGEKYGAWVCDCGKDVDPQMEEAFVVHASVVMATLQRGNFEEAVDHVREHSLFAKQPQND